MTPLNGGAGIPADGTDAADADGAGQEGAGADTAGPDDAGTDATDGPDGTDADSAGPDATDSTSDGTDGPDTTGPHGTDARASVADGLRFAFGTLTVLPVRVTRWDRPAARTGMLCAPAAGAVVGPGAAALGALLLLAGAAPLLAAVAAVAVPAVLTRGLHLDGLADTADGLGSGQPAEAALRIMKRSDIGPFGVITLVLTLLAQIAAVAGLYGQSPARGAVAVALAGVTARLALTVACRTGVPPARPDGLGAAVAGTVPVRAATGAVLLVTGVCAAAGALFGICGAVRHGLAVLAALGAAWLLLRHCVRRFGGVTGDVFGALAETAATTALVVLTLG